MIAHKAKTLIQLLLVVSAVSVLQTNTASSSEYEIPLSELNKVKKKYHAKKETHKRHIKKGKKQAQEQPVTTDNAEPVKQKIEPLDEKSVAIKSVSQKNSNQKNPQSSISSETELSAIKISHTPYSYIVSGKRTIVQAVISSSTSIVKVYCYFHTTGSNNGAAVQMSKMDGTNFTYTTIIPALNSNSTGLSYKIYAIDSNGITTQSKEYTIPTSTTAVSPGWQPDNFKDILQIQQDDLKKNLDGFSDPVLNKK